MSKRTRTFVLITCIGAAVMAVGSVFADNEGATTEAEMDPPNRTGEGHDAAPAWDAVEPADRGPGRRGRPGDRRSHAGGRPDGKFGRPGRGGRDRRSEADMDRMRKHIDERLEILREIQPEMAERLEQHIEQRGGVNPERLRMVIGERFQRVERLLSLKREDPDAYQLAIADLTLERKARELADGIRGQGGDDIQRQQLRTAIAEHFDVRQRKYEHELHRLEQRIAELRRQLDTRRQHRETLEQSRFDELVATPERPEW